jgi:hypothetical protein
VIAELSSHNFQLLCKHEPQQVCAQVSHGGSFMAKAWGAISVCKNRSAVLSSQVLESFRLSLDLQWIRKYYFFRPRPSLRFFALVLTLDGFPVSFAHLVSVEPHLLPFSLRFVCSCGSTKFFAEA